VGDPALHFTEAPALAPPEVIISAQEQAVLDAEVEAAAHQPLPDDDDADLLD